MRALGQLCRLLLLLIGSLSTTAHADQSQSLQGRVDGVFKSWARSDAPGCAVGVTEKEKWRAQGGYGAADIEGQRRISPSTVFYIASVSKQFTAAALLSLIQQGRIRFDDDVRQYITELPEYSTPVLLRHLVHHTSGIPDFIDLLQKSGTLHDPQSANSVIALLAKQPSSFPAGQIFSYSNSNYLLMGEIVARVSGLSLREYTKRTLFTPLGMADTRFHDDHTEVQSRRATGYVEARRGHFKAVKTGYELVGAGGLLTTLSDLGKWTRIFYDGNALQSIPNLGQRLQERGKLADGTYVEYAFGLVASSADGEKIATHLGHFPGFSASYTWVPARRTAVIVLCNWSAPIQAITDIVIHEAMR